MREAVNGQRAAAWKQRWLTRPSWNPSELAKLCLGWDPETEVFPDAAAYNKAVEAIRRAANAGHLQPLELKYWKPTDAQVIYAQNMEFRPTEASKWATVMYPDTFPYSERDFVPAKARNVRRDFPTPDMLPDAVVELVKLAAERRTAAPIPQKELEAIIEARLKVSNRTAQGLAKMIRPDHAAAVDGRNTRHKK